MTNEELASQGNKAIGAMLARLLAQREALHAVNELWTQNALDFPTEVIMGSPVGQVWEKVRFALGYGTVSAQKSP